MSVMSDRAHELRKIWGGFQPARVLLTANNYRVFDYLKRQKTAGRLAKILGTDRRATEILLDALIGIGLLRKKNGEYKNNHIASQLLVSGNPYYQGDIIKHVDTLWQNWTGLDRVLKTGTPDRTSQNHEAFILGMHNLSVLKAKEVIREIGLKDVKKALDLGGGPGTYTIEMAKKGVFVTLFDTPETIRISKRVIKRTLMSRDTFSSGSRTSGVINNIDFIQGDFLSDNLGKGYDLILISQIFHAFSEKENSMLLKKACNALNNRGRVVIQEFFIHEDRTHPAQSALFSVNMLVNTGGGRCYSPQEIKKWCVSAGFKRTKKKLLNDFLLVVAER